MDLKVLLLPRNSNLKQSYGVFYTKLLVQQWNGVEKKDQTRVVILTWLQLWTDKAFI